MGSTSVSKIIKTTSISTRTPWIDIYKSLAIFLVIAGHSASPLNGFLYGFHIPAFFFISGYTFNFNNINCLNFFSKKLKQLIKPYIIFNLIFLLNHYVLQKIYISHYFYDSFSDQKLNLLSIFNNLFSFTQTDPFGGATWFLVTLFETFIIAYLLIFFTNKYISKSKFVPLFFSFILLFFSYYFIFPHFPQTILNYNFDIVPMSLFFLIIGFTFQKLELTISNKFHFILMFLSTISLLILSKYHPSPINFPTRNFGNLLFVIPTTIFGIIFLVFIAKLIDLIPLKRLKKLFEYIGKSTLNILIFHFLIFKLFFILLSLFNKQPFSYVSNLVPLTTYRYWFQLTIFTIFTILIGQYFFDKYKTKIFIFIKKIVPLLLIASITLILQKWILSSNNFFFQDDFSHLANSIKPFNFNLLPSQVYNDRPVGTFFIKFLFNIFGFRYRYHHLILLTIHITNAVLIYFLFLKISKLFLKNSFKIKIVSLMTATIFANWPKSIMAASWDAAIFDLLLTFLFLIYFNLILNYSNIISKLSSIIIFILMIRTKESAVFLPFIPLLCTFFFNKKSKNLIIILISCLIGITYFIYLFILGKNGGFSNFSPENPYFTSFNPIILIKNLFIYIYLYINPHVGGFSFTKFSILNLILPIVFISLTLCFTIKNRKLLFVFISFIISLIPVLPLVNTQHKLYLYLPSIFFAYLLVLIIFNVTCFFTKNPIPFFILIISSIIIYQNIFNNTFLSEKKWWLSIGRINHQVFENIKNIPYDNSNKTIYISNIEEPSTNIFLYGPGHVLNAYYKNINLKTILIDKGQLPQNNYCLIDYNDGNLIDLGCK